MPPTTLTVVLVVLAAYGVERDRGVRGDKRNSRPGVVTDDRIEDERLAVGGLVVDTDGAHVRHDAILDAHARRGLREDAVGAAPAVDGEAAKHDRGPRRLDGDAVVPRKHADA